MTVAQGWRRAGRPGFTLVELLVAIWIMSVVAIIAWRGLSALVATRDRLAPEVEQVRAVLTTFGQMERDLAQAVNPALIQMTAQPSVRMPVIQGTRALQVLRLTEPLPDGGSAIQQVTYTVIDGALLRQSTLAARSVQASQAGTPTTVRLLDGVASMQVREWRPIQGWVVPPPGDPVQPMGIEIELTRSDGTVLRRVLLVG